MSFELTSSSSFATCFSDFSPALSSAASIVDSPTITSAASPASIVFQVDSLSYKFHFVLSTMTHVQFVSLIQFLHLRNDEEEKLPLFQILTCVLELEIFFD